MERHERHTHSSSSSTYVEVFFRKILLLSTVCAFLIWISSFFCATDDYHSHLSTPHFLLRHNHQRIWRKLWNYTCFMFFLSFSFSFWTEKCYFIDFWERLWDIFDCCWVACIYTCIERWTWEENSRREREKIFHGCRKALLKLTILETDEKEK